MIKIRFCSLSKLRPHWSFKLFCKPEPVEQKQVQLEDLHLFFFSNTRARAVRRNTLQGMGKGCMGSAEAEKKKKLNHRYRQ